MNRSFSRYALAIAVISTGIFIADAQTSGKGGTSAKRVVREKRVPFERPEVERRSKGERERESRGGSRNALLGGGPRAMRSGPAKAGKLHITGKSFDGDVSELPYEAPIKRERPERELPRIAPRPFAQADGAAAGKDLSTAKTSTNLVDALLAPAPAPIITFDGLDNANWGAGHPPDTNGDVGPTYFIQTINSSIGIYRKTDGVRVAAFTLDTFMSQGSFGNLCDTDNFGDPVVLYDSFEDRWVITDFAFQLDASNNVINPPGAFQCVAVSKTGDPVAGGWNFYYTNTTGGLGDYPKLGVWNDGIYMSVNMFDYAASGSYQNPRVFAFNKAQMYAGAPTVQIVSFNTPAADFSLLPSNARLQTGTPPSGRPNLFAVVAQYLNVFSVYKFHVDWDHISLSSFTGPFDSATNNWWEQLAAANQTAPTPANRNDELYGRLMMQNQYTNLGGVESLWASQTVGAGNPGASNVTATQAAVRFYQVKVTGGNVEAAPTQAWTYSPDASLWRYMPSSAVDRAGNMAIGYTTSNAATHPALAYAAQTAGVINGIDQTEQVMYQGTGSQSGSCGGTCTRWGDYSAMTLDPDGCTFWYTSQYYAVSGLNHLTRIGSFKLTGCTPVGAGGTISGKATTDGTTAISGATIVLGSRSTTTDVMGNYSFPALPAGTYPAESASKSGFTPQGTMNVAVADGSTTTVNFTMPVAATSGCPTDTTQTDFQAGIPTNTDLTASAGNVVLAVAEAVDAQATTETQAFGFSSTSWVGQTFTPTVTGKATQVSLDLFCSSCTGTPPNVVISIRNASGNLPTGADLASASVPFSNDAAGGFYTAVFTTPPTLTAGTQYAIVARMAATYATGTPAYITSTTSSYAGGRRTTSANSGTSWTGTTPDLSFKVTMNTGYFASGDFVSTLRDANPLPGRVPTWGTFTFNGTAPANTTIKLQVAASNSIYGPFNYVGPGGTAATFFTSGDSLAQFNGSRYLRYKAFLTTTNSAATPQLNDAAVCFQNLGPTAAAVSVSGRVVGTGGTGIRNASVSIIDGQGATRTAVTNAFGYYTFDTVQSGGTYLMRASARGYTFSPKTVTVTDTLSGIDFVSGQ